MATADEKQAKQDAIDAQKASVTTGQQRLQTEVQRAAGAFPVRRLRSAGDLSRYAIGGFLSDPNAPLPGGSPGSNRPPAPATRPTGSGTGGGSGSGVSSPGQPVTGSLPPIGAGSSMGVGGAPGAYRPPAALPPGTSNGLQGAPGAYRPPAPATKPVQSKARTNAKTAPSQRKPVQAKARTNARTAPNQRKPVQSKARTNAKTAPNQRKPAASQARMHAKAPKPSGGSIRPKAQ